MAFFGSERPKKLKRKNYSMKEVMEFALDERVGKYYEFIPINPNNLKEGFRPMPIKEAREYIDKVKRENNTKNKLDYLKVNRKDLNSPSRQTRYEEINTREIEDKGDMVL